MTVRTTDLANPAWVGATVRRHHRELGLARAPAAIDLLDVRIKNPHRPESTRCRGWATVRVADLETHRRAADPVFLIRSEESGAASAGGVVLSGLPLRVWRFPDDPGLPVLRILADPGRARDLLPEDLAAGHRVEHVRLLRWQPGVSAVARCVVVGPGGRVVLFAKLLASGDVSAVDAVQRRLFLEGRPGLLVAEPLGVAAGHGILWTRQVVGRPLEPGLRRGGRALVDRVARQVGRSLAALHTATTALPLPPVRADEVVAEAAKKADKIASVQTVHATAVRRLAAAAVPCDVSWSPLRPLHGDCHIDQMLLTPEDLVLLDLDEMVAGDPALDLAELAVDLGLRRVAPATTGRFLSVMAQAYDRGGGTPPAHDVLRGYAAAELLNRCYRHLRRPVPGWEEALAADLGAVGRVLGGADRLVRATGATCGSTTDEVRT